HRSSADGRYLAFDSDASDLVPGDTNVCGFCSEADSRCKTDGDCPLGICTAYRSCSDVFVHDRVTDVTERVSVDSNGRQGDDDSFYPTITADGRYVAFSSLATNLVPGDTNAALDIFVHDRVTDTTERVSIDSGGAQANKLPLIPGTGPAITAD